MTPPKRLQSQTERDIEGLAARKEREQAAPEEFAGEEDSMAHEVPVRKAIRDKRDTKERIEKLETFKDAAIERLGKIEVESAKHTTSLVNIEKYMDRAEKREQARIELETAQRTAQVDVDKAEALDSIDARKAKRHLIYKVLGGGTVLGAIIAKLLGYAGVL